MNNNMFVISAILFMALIYLPQAGHGQWIKQVIDPYLDGACWIFMIDFDGDKDKDVLATGYKHPLVAWYENKGGLPVNWQRHTIDNTLPTPHELQAGDLDGDGDLDVVVGESRGGLVVWFENLGGMPFNWRKCILDSLPWATFITIEDIDRDGDLDVAASTYYSKFCCWYENLGGSPPEWRKYPFGEIGGRFLRFVDMDGDSALDLITNHYEGKILWYKNNLPDTNWTLYYIEDLCSRTRVLRVADMDNDSDTDIVITMETNNHVYWLENMGGMPMQWQRHLIDDKLLRPSGIDLADIDGDSLLDVATSYMKSGKVVWYKNNLPDPVWTINTIDPNLPGADECITDDFDFDGDPDVFASDQLYDKIVWYRNVLNQAHVQSLQCQPSYVPLSGDTLRLNAEVHLPDNHQAVVYALINDTLNGFRDSLQLFDDGLHNDHLAQDGIWGNQTFFKPQNETIYLLSTSTYDITKNVHSYKPDFSAFTSLGPIEYTGFTFDRYDTVFAPGNQIAFNIQITNRDISNTITDVRAEINSPSPMITFVEGFSSAEFNDIAPGESQISKSIYACTISEEATPGVSIYLPIKIFSNGYPFWADTMKVDIVTETEIAHNQKFIPKEFSLLQNYPNPFNPLTNIEFSLPKSEFVELKVYNVLGKVVSILVDKKLNQGNYTYTFNGKNLASGIYYYQLMAGEYREVRKMILIR